MTARAAQVLALAGPITLWALHFIAVYALVSAACSPRLLITIPVLRSAVLVATVFAGLAAALPLLRLSVGENGGDLATAIRLCALLSILAIFANALTFVFFGAC